MSPSHHHLTSAESLGAQSTRLLQNPINNWALPGEPKVIPAESPSGAIGVRTRVAVGGLHALHTLVHYLLM
jgi:hypothetical protein